MVFCVLFRRKWDWEGEREAAEGAEAAGDLPRHPLCSLLRHLAPIWNPDCASRILFRCWRLLAFRLDEQPC